MIENRSIFITGGASGIGEATVRYFYNKGWRVGFADVDQKKAQQLLESLNFPERVSFYFADVRSFESVSQAVELFVAEYGSFDAVFANAGIHLHSDAVNTSLDSWNEIIDVNINGVFYTLKATLPILVARKKGAVILMGSDQSLIAKKNSFAYGASKGAIGQMTKSLALDYAKNNIRVNCVGPATIDTPLTKKILSGYAKRYYQGDLEKVMELEASEFPLQRIGTSEEVAKVVYFLASEESSYITGTLIPIDGGYTAQ